MSKTYTIPETPADWLQQTPIQIQSGCLPNCLVIHSSDSQYHPFVVHCAVATDNGWSYCHGDYCETLEEAEKAFDKRK